MDIEQELNLLRLKNKFIFTLNDYITNISDTIFLESTLNMLKLKYKDTDDFNFLEKIRENINSKNRMNNLNMIIFNYRNDKVILDLIKTMDYNS